jgi:multisubunit Na+/H+ antiporter MnhG subunit
MELYEIKLHEVLWGCLLVAITMSIHGTATFAILRFVELLKERLAPMDSFAAGLGLVILASLMIVVVNIVEVVVWTVFFFLTGALTNHHTAFYYAMLNFTTLQAGYLPLHWRPLEPMLGMAGLLTVAWSTGILYMLAQDFQNTQLEKRRRLHAVQRHPTRPTER